ncbi:hypothetical protein MBLNU459_g2304t1 [Dothideomycetes sp. NU459]
MTIRHYSNARRPLVERIPADTWDSHMHVTSPHYPLAANAAYKPSLHSLQHAMDFEKTIGTRNIVLVQPSIYGDDNSCLLDALEEIGPRHGRGVVEINPKTIKQEKLTEWHRLGVRGVRLNLVSTKAKFTDSSLREMMQAYADIVRPLDWVLELFIAMDKLPMLEPIVPDLGVKVCIAHLAIPPLPAPETTTYPLDPYSFPDFQSLVNLLRGGKTWAKCSAAYRADHDSQMRGFESVARELFRVRGDRIVFASDWPHTRFEGLDVKPFVEKCLDWAESEEVTEQVFSLNAKELWDAE